MISKRIANSAAMPGGDSRVVAVRGRSSPRGFLLIVLEVIAKSDVNEEYSDSTEEKEDVSGV